MTEKKKMLIVFGRGGHTEQLSRLVNKLGSRFNYEYVIGKEDKTSEQKIKYPGKVYRVLNPRLMTDKSLFIVALKMVPSTFGAIKVLFSTKADVVLSAGPSLAIPFFVLGKIFRKKTIFVESWVRVRHKSMTGKLVYRFSDLFFVQWPEMCEVYPKAVYAGRLS